MCNMNTNQHETKPRMAYRIHAQQPDGNIGITGWYSAEIEAVKDEIKAQGHTIIMIEQKEIETNPIMDINKLFFK